MTTLTCHTCHLLSHAPALRAPRTRLRCPRCESALHRRKPHSIQRTWALVIASFILYIPANTLPILYSVRLGDKAADTIMSGVEMFIHEGQWPLAALIFFASIVVPVLKLVGLCVLLISVQLRWQRWARERAHLYRIIETIGRWSMIDIFMISILVALVKLGSVATIEPGAGATCFAAVVVLTMFAASSFDPRLIWDVLDDEAK